MLFFLYLVRFFIAVETRVPATWTSNFPVRWQEDKRITTDTTVYLHQHCVCFFKQDMVVVFFLHTSCPLQHYWSQSLFDRLKRFCRAATCTLCCSEELSQRPVLFASIPNDVITRDDSLRERRHHQRRTACIFKNNNTPGVRRRWVFLKIF